MKRGNPATIFLLNVLLVSAAVAVAWSGGASNRTVTQHGAISPADGAFKVLTQFTTDLILDASGYFAP